MVDVFFFQAESAQQVASAKFEKLSDNGKQGNQMKVSFHVLT